MIENNVEKKTEHDKNLIVENLEENINDNEDHFIGNSNDIKDGINNDSNENKEKNDEVGKNVKRDMGKDENKRDLIFSSILRYKKYLTKKGNNYFEFSQTNLQINENEMLVHNSNFFHLFDIKTIFFPHIFLNVNSHININISDYLNYIQKYSNICDTQKNIHYNSRQDFVLEAIENIKHVEVFKNVMLLNSLFLTLNQKNAEQLKTHFDSIEKINSSDLVFVQTNRKNDMILGYIKDSKYNLIFEVFNFKKFFEECYNDDVYIDIFEINKKKMDEHDFINKNENGKIYLKELKINEKKKIHTKSDTFKKFYSYSVYQYDYYFFKRSIIECLYLKDTKKWEERGRKCILSLNLCLKYVNDNLFVMILYSYDDTSGNDINFGEKSVCKNKKEKHLNNNNINNFDSCEKNILQFEDLIMYNNQFDLNKVDKNLFKRNTFFVNDLCYPLKCKILGIISFTNLCTGDYIRHIYFTKLKKYSYNFKNEYKFNLYCLSNDGVLYTFDCLLEFQNIYTEENFKFDIKKYYNFQINKECSCTQINVIKFSSKYLYSISFINNIVSPTNFSRKNNDHHVDNSNSVQKKKTSYSYDFAKENNENIFMECEEEVKRNSDLKFNIYDDKMHSKNNRSLYHSNSTCRNKKYNDFLETLKNQNDMNSQVIKCKYKFIVITAKYDIFIITLKKEKKNTHTQKNDNTSKEIVNFSSTNNNNKNNVICRIVINKYNFEKYNEIKCKNKSCVLFELICFYKNGYIKKYNYICTYKNNNFEFYLFENEQIKYSSIAKKQFFVPTLFSFNDEIIKKKKETENEDGKNNSLNINNTAISLYKSLIYLYYEEKKYENISMAINDQCLTINYVKAFSKWFKKIYKFVYKRHVYKCNNNCTITDQINKCSNYYDNNFHQKDNNNIDPCNNLCIENNKDNIHINKNETNSIYKIENSPLYLNMLVKKENKTFFWEYKYILFGFYDLFLINEKNNLSHVNDERKNVDKKNLKNSYDAHSHFNFINIVKEYFSYDNILTCINSFPQNLNMKKKKIKLNFYYFINFLNFLQNNYIHEYVSVFHLVFNQLNEKTQQWENKIGEIIPNGCKSYTICDGCESWEVRVDRVLKKYRQFIDVRKYCPILFSFFVHMYNFCLKGNGLNNDAFISHITYFLINKNTKINKKRYRYLQQKEEKIREGANEVDNISPNILNKNSTPLNEDKHECVNDECEIRENGDTKKETKTMFRLENNKMKSINEEEFEKKNKKEIEIENLLTNFITLKKFLYYVNKVSKYLDAIYSITSLNCGNRGERKKNNNNNDNSGGNNGGNNSGDNNGGNNGGDNGGELDFYVYVNISICQVLYTMMHTLRINNTNKYANSNYNLKKNNMDYFYLLILVNFYTLFSILLTQRENVLKCNTDKNKKNIEQKTNLDKKIIEKDLLIHFYNELYEINKNNTNLKDQFMCANHIEIKREDFQKYLNLIYKLFITIIDQIDTDDKLIEKIYFKINCCLCGNISLSNLYNNYYICEKKHIFNKCMITFCCIYKNCLILPNIFLFENIHKNNIYDPNNHILNFDLNFKITNIYFCPFCHYFITTDNHFFNQIFIFTQCPFCSTPLANL
ncbi:conserved Plasmodium protein, unknown function [Plasmodium yoelii]|uniref:Uncharacterized protein n=1 Tax=Plasmodium yoelii TaxID=5861 RepID=A0A078KFS4_PLAYE|nr:conserved Plasmodium protein, unknown function [Plasmodium yoelii]CDU20755.1 conserved Plasmodium protein, unknown function [Plasmodium yoelii]VTZ81718.1 conserved Plasmodium protein, unknown function [Plasmodium yoelii]|eukprot:XP_727451.2 conserved Plasmodium protein, unknown function [Plasmodium yoelii]